jgi:hypothetical protein
MDPVKIAVFVGAFIALFLLMRLLSSSSDKTAALPVPHPIDPEPITDHENKDPIITVKQPAMVGADLPFPVRLPDLEIRDDGTYNRPEFLNYYFSHIDLVGGPLDPSSFYDEFFVETRDPKDERVGTYKYLVATPTGLQREMSAERLSVMSLGDQTIVVRWDLTLILDTAVQDIIKTYGGWARYSGEHAFPMDESDS